MNILENENEFDGLISSELTIVDFYANWCTPCKMIAPILEELDVKVVKVDVDTFNGIATKYGVMSIPTLIFFKDGEMLAKEIGFRSKEELETLINQYE